MIDRYIVISPFRSSDWFVLCTSRRPCLLVCASMFDSLFLPPGFSHLGPMKLVDTGDPSANNLHLALSVFFFARLSFFSFHSSLPPPGLFYPLLPSPFYVPRFFLFLWLFFCWFEKITSDQAFRQVGCSVRWRQQVWLSCFVFFFFVCGDRAKQGDDVGIRSEDGDEEEDES